VVSARGQEAVERARELTDGGANHVLECVGSESSMDTAVQVARPGGTVDLDGVPGGYRAMDEREAIKVMVKV